MSDCQICNAPLTAASYGMRKGEHLCRPCYQEAYAEDLANEAKCDRWHDGYFAKTRPTDPDELEGWLHRRSEQRVQVIMPERPEGYYHLPVGTFS